MKTRILLATFFTLPLLSVSPLAAADGMTRLDSKPGNLKVRIEGTSTIHDWRMESPVIGGFLEVGVGFPMEPGAEAKPGPVPAKGETFIPVRSLKSLEKDGKPYNDRMNEVAWEHLKAATNKNIQYYLTELVLKTPAAAKDAAYVFDSKGQLVVAGVTNTIAMPVNVLPLGNKTFKITGTVAVKMTDYGISPPSPTLGILIKTGDEVKLFFEWIVWQRPPPAAAAK